MAIERTRIPKEVTREQFISALAGLCGAMVQETKNPARIPKYLIKQEIRDLNLICSKAGIVLTDEERDRVLGG